MAHRVFNYSFVHVLARIVWLTMVINYHIFLFDRLIFSLYNFFRVTLTSLIFCDSAC